LLEVQLFTVPDPNIYVGIDGVIDVGIDGVIGCWFVCHFDTDQS